MIVLEGFGQRAAVDPRGAALCGWTAGGRERVSAFDRDDRSWAFDGVTLMPWPNRRRDAEIHGSVHSVEWQVAERDATWVRLHTSVGPAFEGSVRYALGDGGLECALSATNVSDAPARFGCGSHPYLAVAADDAGLDLPARSRIPTDERGLPTGPPEPVGTLGRELDTCFTDLERDGDGLARVRAGGIVVWLDPSFGFVQVYTGDLDPDPQRRRTRIAIEPMTCAPDAFNTGLGLLTLAPGGRFHGRWGLTLDQETP